MDATRSDRIVVITPDVPWARTEAARRWCAAHGIATQDCYRIEIDPDAAENAVTVYEFDRDAGGHLYRSPTNPLETAVRAPRGVPLRELPDALDVLRADHAAAEAERRRWAERARRWAARGTNT